MKRSVVVQKYGGSSVATPEKVKQVAQRVAVARGSSPSLLVVVSAMGKTTNRLLDLARGVTSTPSPRELDMLLSSGERISASLLSMALHELGIDSVSLTGSQAGIVTDERHANARVVEVRTGRIRDELDRGRVVVVAGYQGASASGEVTTLGRGGSDTSAVAFAGAIGAEACHICSDVDGVYTSDPRVVEPARRLDEVSYEEMLEMARCGASVLNPQAVALAHGAGTEILARASFEDGGGTWIRAVGPGAALAGGRAISVAGHDRVLHVTGGPAIDESTRRALRQRIEDEEVLFGSVGQAGSALDVVLSTENVAEPEALEESLRRESPALRIDSANGTVSVVGYEVGGYAEMVVAARRALDADRAYVDRHSISFVIPREQVVEALRVLHRSFVEERTWAPAAISTSVGASSRAVAN